MRKKGKSDLEAPEFSKPWNTTKMTWHCWQVDQVVLPELEFEILYDFHIQAASGKQFLRLTSAPASAVNSTSAHSKLFESGFVKNCLSWVDCQLCLVENHVIERRSRRKICSVKRQQRLRIISKLLSARFSLFRATHGPGGYSTFGTSVRSKGRKYPGKIWA